MKLMFLSMLLIASLNVFSQVNNNKGSNSEGSNPEKENNPNGNKKCHQTDGIVKSKPITICNDQLSECPDCCETDFIVYDFKCKRLFQVSNGSATPIRNLNTIRVRYNEELRFRIINVNRYIYDVDFAADDVEFGSEPPALFSKLFLGSDIEIPSLAPEKDGGQNIDTKDLLAFIVAYKEFKELYDSLLEGQLRAYSLCPDLKCACTDHSIKFTELSTRMTNLKSTYQKALAVTLKALPDLQKALDELTKPFNDCSKKDELLKTYNDELKKLNEAKPLDQKAIDKKKKEIKDLNDCKLSVLETELEKAKKDRDEMQAAKDNLDKIFQNIVALTDDKLMELVLFNHNLAKEHLSYLAPPIYPQGNRLVFGFKISPMDSDKSLVSKWNIMPLYNDSVNFDLPVLHKPFVSFSSGLFTAFGKKLQSETFAYVPVPNAGGVVENDSMTYRITSTGNNSLPLIGFAAYSNLGFKFSNILGAGISVGAGLTLEDAPRPSYLGGVSLFVGDKQQLNFTFGVAAMQVSRLKKELYPDMATRQYEEREDLQYSKELKAGYSLSITYTAFTMGNKKNTRSKSKKK